LPAALSSAKTGAAKMLRSRNKTPKLNYQVAQQDQLKGQEVNRDGDA
jgi:hypothetical protein